jgi:ABC-2 type transport system permease protein
MSQPGISSSAIFPSVLKLLRLRWRINYNSFRHAKTRRKVLTIIGLLGLVAFAGLAFWLSWVMLRFLRSPRLLEYIGSDVTPLLQAVPVLIFSGLFIGILLTSFGVLLQALYLSGDMDFLLTTPVPVRAVFVTKLLQAVLPNFGLMALFGLPVMYGLGVAGHYSWIYYPLVLLMMIVMTLAAAGLSSLLVMAIVRIFPARRVAEVLGFVGAIFSMICSQSGNFSNSLMKGADPKANDITGLFSMVQRMSSSWVPLNWPGRGLVELGEGRWAVGILLTCLSLGMAAAAFWFALVTAERWYYSGWARMQVVTNKRKFRATAQADSQQPSQITRMIERYLPAPVRGIIQRDFLILTRDLRHMSQLVSPLIFGLLYSFMMIRSGGEPPAGRGEAPTWFMETLSILLVYGNIGMSLFVGWMLLGALSGTAVSREGKSFWILKSAPVNLEHLLLAKFLVAYLPALGLGWFFLTGISLLQGISVGGYLYGLLAVAMCLVGMNGILLAFGAANANFEWEDPRKINSGAMGCLATILTGMFLPVSFGVFIAPIIIASAVRLPLILGYLLGALLGVIINLVSAWLPLKIALTRMARLGEN